MQITVEVRAGRNLDSFLEDGKPKGVNVRILPGLLYRDVSHDTVTFIVEFSAGVSSALVAAWLIGKFNKQPPKKTTIREREITWDEGELTGLIERELKIEEGDQSQDEEQKQRD